MDHATREFKQKVEDLCLPWKVKRAILARWEMGRAQFAGTDEDCLRPGYDAYGAQREELMDAVAYGLALEIRGDADAQSRTRTAVAAGLLVTEMLLVAQVSSTTEGEGQAP